MNAEQIYEKHFANAKHYTLEELAAIPPPLSRGPRRNPAKVAAFREWEANYLTPSLTHPQLNQMKPGAMEALAEIAKIPDLPCHT